MSRDRRRGRKPVYDSDSEFDDYDDDDYYNRDRSSFRSRSLSRLKSLGQGLSNKLERTLGFERNGSPQRSLRKVRSLSRSRSRSRSYDSDSDYSDRDYRPRNRSRGRGRAYYSRSRSRESDYYRPRSRSGDRLSRRDSYSGSTSTSSRRRPLRSLDQDRARDKSQRRWSHAAMAGFDTALVEAMRVRKEPGSWTGGKGARVATAALGAAAVDAIIDRNPEHHRKRKTVESTLGGLLLNRVVNGPKRDLRRGYRY